MRRGVGWGLERESERGREAACTCATATATAAAVGLLSLARATTAVTARLNVAHARLTLGDGGGRALLLLLLLLLLRVWLLPLNCSRYAACVPLPATPLTLSHTTRCNVPLPTPDTLTLNSLLQLDENKAPRTCLTQLDLAQRTVRQEVVALQQMVACKVDRSTLPELQGLSARWHEVEATETRHGARLDELDGALAAVGALQRDDAKAIATLRELEPVVASLASSDSIAALTTQVGYIFLRSRI